MQNIIKDYEFIEDISQMFERKVVIYGAGYWGSVMAGLLDDICVDYECFCDRDENKKEYLGHQVVKIDELKKKTNQEEYFIIIASINYCDEIAEELAGEQIDAYVCSWYGVQKGIEINIEDERLPEAYKDDFIHRKDTWMRVYDDRGLKGIICQQQMYLCSHPDAILVYLPEKVGSSTLRNTMQNKNIPVIRVHYLCHSYITGRGKLEFREHTDGGWAETISYMRKKRMPLKIIVSVREPVGRSLSNFMQWFGSHDYTVCYDNHLGFKNNVYSYIERELKEDYEFTWWFDEELKAVTGIDVYKYPFDKKRGYTWIKEDGIELLLIKMEQMNENQDVIGTFIGREEFKLMNDNVGKGKRYRYIYEQLKKEIRFPAEVIKNQYYNERFKHFYTEEEMQRFLEKWS